MTTRSHRIRSAGARVRPLIRARLLACLVLSACVAAVEPPADVRPLAPEPATATPTPCPLILPTPSPAAVRCLTVQVPEDRERPQDGTVALHVVVVASPAAPGDADPLFFFTGGPGQAASDGLAGTVHELASVLATRDLVFIDQRGTGLSQPLRCDLDRTEDALRGWLTGDFPRAAIRACRERLLARGINPARYATADAVMDAEAVRHALAYDRVNLLGVSYGTRVALEYLRRYPHHVRTVTLRGLHAPDSGFPRHVAGDAQRALDLALQACEGDASCNAAFPAVRDDMRVAFARARTRPVRLPLGEDGARSDSIAVTPGILAGTLLFSLYSADGAAAVPMAARAAARGDVSQWVAPGLLTAYSASQTISLGMYLSVVCAEDLPRAEGASDRDRSGFLGDTLVRNLVAACAEWLPGAVAPPAPALRSSVPVLILNGDIDPVTPPHWGETLLEGMPNGRQVVFAGVGHIPSMPQCATRMVARFIQTADVRAVDAACAPGGRRPPFALPSTPKAPGLVTARENVQGTWDLYWQTARGPSQSGYLVIAQRGDSLDAEIHGSGELKASGVINGREVLLTGRRIVPFEIRAHTAGDTLRGSLKVLTTERRFTGIRRH